MHSSCSAGYELMSDYSAGLETNMAKAELRLFLLKEYSVFYLISSGDCGALNSWGE